MNTKTLKIATWNVLLRSDEYDPSWGNPLSIALCGDRPLCAAARWERIWRELSGASDVDLALLQEAEDGFLSSAPPGWEVLERSGECAVLGRAGMDVVDAYRLDAPGLAGCPSVPIAAVALGEGEVHVGSVHLEASADLNDWFENLNLPPQFGANETLIIGGDFNQNLTDFRERDGWSVASSKSNSEENGLRGTSQKEHNWMGNFDGFFARSSPRGPRRIRHSEPSVLLRGFMPKVVAEYPRGDEAHKVAQFRWSNDSGLLFSPTSTFGDDTFVVPSSHPLEEALSDHLMITTAFWVDETSSEGESKGDVEDVVSGGEDQVASNQVVRDPRTDPSLEEGLEYAATNEGDNIPSDE